MNFIESYLKNVYLIDLKPFKDERGFFTRVFCKDLFDQIGFEKNILQINHSFTQKKASFRGFHFQYPPCAESKIIRCIRGKVLDIVIDIRQNSETFLQHQAIELSESNFKMILIPEGFAHGFQTLEDNCEMLYLHTAFYNKEFEGALNYADPRLKICLPLEVTDISEKDKNHSFIHESFKGLKI